MARYYSGFVTPVLESNRQAYIEHARKAWPFFQRFGALRIVETWGTDIPDGKVTDFRRAVQAQPGETVVMSWIEWPDRATCDAAWPKMEADAEMMAAMADMPFDGRRMFWGGFECIVDSQESA